MSVVTQDPPASILVNGLRVETVDRGSGRPILFLHPEIGLDPAAPVLHEFAARARIIAPTHPGFGTSDAPKGFDTVDDLAYFYLDLLDELDLRNVVLIGVSLGGWVAAAMAVKSIERLSHVVLANAVGIKVGGRETRDIADIFAITDSEFNALAYFDPSLGERDYKAMPEGDVRVVARNREATARYGWSPYMHDPKLRGRLHRIRIPTLLLWGANDKVLSEKYGRAYCAEIPGATFEVMQRAGHFPHIERPDEFARRIFAFIEGK